MDLMPPADLSQMRREYSATGLASRDLAGDWLTQLSAWLQAATEAGLVEPNAMVLATTGADGRPSARTVLLKGLDERGLVFFTNYGSRKATELAANPHASVVLPWHPLGRQVIVCGYVERAGRAETEEYFATRGRDSQLGAWASPQSRVVASREELESALEQAAQRFPGEVPAPPHWGGLRLVPETVEFWQGRTGRLHDRLRYRRVTTAGGAGWVVERLAP
jgi:pyridoxamine 5'-phosphate oxidase